MRNIQDTKEFVTNVVTHELRHRMRITAASWPSETDEITKTGLTTVDPRFVRPPVQAGESLDRLQVAGDHSDGSSSVVFGDVLCFHIADEVMTNGRVTAELLRPMGKLHGSNYATVNAIERPDLPAELTREVADFDKAHR